MKSISKEKAEHVVKLLEEGYTQKEAADVTGVSCFSVAKIKAKHAQHVAKQIPGRKKSLTSREERFLVQKITTGDICNAVEGARLVSSELTKVLSARIVQRVLKQNGLRATTKKKKPFLTTLQQKKRLSFALKYHNYTIEDWKQLVFSDEVQFNRMGSHGREYVWVRKNQENNNQQVKPTLKYGGRSLMYCRCFSWHGVH